MIIEKNTKLVTEISLILDEYVSQLLGPLTYPLLTVWAKNRPRGFAALQVGDTAIMGQYFQGEWWMRWAREQSSCGENNLENPASSASHPVKIDLNKKFDSKQKTIQAFNIDAQGFRKTRNENPPIQEIGVTS